MNRVFLIGVGMTKFEKPARRDWDYPDMARESVTAALADTGIGYDQIERVTAGYCYGDSTAGHNRDHERDHRPIAGQPAIVSPPLTLRTWPVTYAARSEAKNTMASATSSGRAIRLNGMARVSASLIRSG